MTTIKKPLYIALATLQQRAINLKQRTSMQVANVVPMLGRVEAELERLVREYLPSGSGFDAGTTLVDQSNARFLVFSTQFHHMTHGSYDGWTEHYVVVTPVWEGCMLRVTGPERDDILDYVAEVFHAALTEEVEYQPMPDATA